jgi:hypothetical protein
MIARAAIIGSCGDEYDENEGDSYDDDVDED